MKINCDLFSIIIININLPITKISILIYILHIFINNNIHFNQININNNI